MRRVPLGTPASELGKVEAAEFYGPEPVAGFLARRKGISYFVGPTRTASLETTPGPSWVNEYGCRCEDLEIFVGSCGRGPHTDGAAALLVDDAVDLDIGEPFVSYPNPTGPVKALRAATSRPSPDHRSASFESVSVARGLGRRHLQRQAGPRRLDAGRHIGRTVEARTSWSRRACLPAQRSAATAFAGSWLATTSTPRGTGRP